jgi:hypothetical protein
MCLSRSMLALPSRAGEDSEGCAACRRWPPGCVALRDEHAIHTMLLSTLCCRPARCFEQGHAARLYCVPLPSLATARDDHATCHLCSGLAPSTVSSRAGGGPRRCAALCATTCARDRARRAHKVPSALYTRLPRQCFMWPSPLGIDRVT